MKVLVTGGAGYVGSAVVRELLKRGHEPVVLDDLSTGHLEAVPEGVEFRHQSVHALARDVANPLLSCDGVIHLAAKTLVGEGETECNSYWRSNVDTTKLLLDYPFRNGVPFVLSSTAAVYRPSECVLPLIEDNVADPASNYGRTKRAAEDLVGMYDRAGWVRGVVFRYFNAAGALPAEDGLPAIGESHDPETHLIPTILKNRSLTIHGGDWLTLDGTCVRDYVHVGDLARAHVEALERSNVRGTFNLGTGRGHSVHEVLCQCSRALGMEDVARAFGPRRPGDVAHLVADAGKAREVLGWEPRHNLASIVSSAWEWHRSPGY